MNLFQKNHAQAVMPCRLCADVPGLHSHMTYEKLRPFIGSRFAGILILGHSPRVRTPSIIDTTLDLNNRRNLYRYIARDVLAPLGLELQECAAINLVRCFTHAMPEDTKINGTPLMDVAFSQCRRHLLHEIREINPRLLISLSQTCSDALQEHFQSSASEPMKDIFGTWRTLDFEGQSVPWIPVVHIPKARVKRYYFPRQTNRLARLCSRVSELPPWDHRDA